MACSLSFAVFILILVASFPATCADLREDHSNNEEGTHMEDHHNISLIVPELQVMRCLAMRGLISGDILELIGRLEATEDEFIEMERSMAQMMNMPNGTYFHGCDDPMTNCSMLDLGQLGSQNLSSVLDGMNETMSRLEEIMVEMNQTFLEIHQLASSGEFATQLQEGFYSARGYDLEMWKECLQSGDDHGHWQQYEQEGYQQPADRFLHSMTFRTLQKLGFREILERHRIDPAEFFSLPTTTEDVWTWERPFIGFRFIRLIEPRLISNLSWIEVMDILTQVELDRESYKYLLSHMGRQKFEQLLTTARELIEQDGMPPPSVLGGIIDATTAHWGPPRRWTPENIDLLWLLALGLQKEHIQQLSSEAFLAVLPNFVTLYDQLDPFISGLIVHAAKRHWGRDITQWTVDNYQQLGPFLHLFSVHDFANINTEKLFQLLPYINQLEFNKRQGQTIISNLASSPDWTWSLEQFQSLGKLSAHLKLAQVKRLPEQVFSDPDVKRTMLENTHGRGREVKEVAKRIAEDMGDPSTWGEEDVAQIGKVASGLVVTDLKKIPKSSIRRAVSDLSEAELSPRQRAVIAKKYRAASTNRTRTKLSADDIHEMKSLAAGLGSEVFAEMSPDDVKEAIDVLSETAKDMHPTQKRQIVRQMKRASGGIAGSLKDLGSMVKEVPLRDLDDVALEDIGTDIATTDDSTEDPVLTLGTIQWNKGQSTKLFRKVKKELLSSGNQSSAVITSSTISMLGTVMVGMTCDDIDRLETHDIFRLTDVMMKQTGWTLRQTRCISRKVREYGGGEVDFMANFSAAEVTSLSGQIMKEFSPEELSHLNLSACDIAFADIGQQQEVEGIRREKRQQIAALAVRCLGKDSSDEIITGDDMESLGHLICELEPDDISKVDVTDLRTDTLQIASRCCYDRHQMVALGEKIVEQLGSTDIWDSSMLEAVAPYLLYLSPHEIESINEDELSTVAEGIMDMYAEFDEKLPLCERDLDAEDLEERQTGFVRVAVKVKDTMVATAASERRRRRDVTYEPSCDEIEILAGGNIAWTPAELAAMNNETFSNCVYVLGTITGLSNDQLDALLDKAKEVWGEPSELTSDEISQLGVIATRFTAAELAVLNLTDIDSVYAIAQHGNWTVEQMEAAVNQYLAVSGKNLSSLDSVELTGLDQFMCGLSSEQILQLSSTAYGDSASSLDALEVCTVEQLSAFKEHAVAVFGEIASWPPEVFTEVNVVVAGFTAEELASLNTSVVAGITPLAINLIPPSTFGNGFTVDLLWAFDEAQALAVTPDQMATLDSDQTLGLTAAAYGGEEMIPEELRIEITGEDGGEEEDPKGGSVRNINQPAVIAASLILLMATVLI